MVACSLGVNAQSLKLPTLDGAFAKSFSRFANVNSFILRTKSYKLFHWNWIFLDLLRIFMKDVFAPKMAAISHKETGLLCGYCAQNP